MREEILGTLYCLGACIVIFYAGFIIWHTIDKVEDAILNIRERKNKWR